MRRNPIHGLILLSLLTAHCSENPVTPDEHFEARGVVLKLADSTVVTVDSNRVTGAIEIDSIAPVRFDITFITTAGSLGVPGRSDDGEESYGLAVNIADTTIARIDSIGFEQQWSATVRGKRAGTTTATIHLLHGGHDDFVSLAIPVVVRP